MSIKKDIRHCRMSEVNRIKQSNKIYVVKQVPNKFPISRMSDYR